MDPILHFLFGLVILIFFLLMITLALWVGSAIGEKNKYRVTIERLRRKLTETKMVEESPQELAVVVNNLVEFALAFYDRNRARGGRVGPTDEIMKECWERLPNDLQKKLAPLGVLSNLKVSDSSSQ